MTGFAPISNGFLNEPSFSIVLCEELGLAVHQFRPMSFQRFDDPGVQLLSRATDEAAMSRILDQCVFEGIYHIRWCATLEDQLRGNQPSHSHLQLVLGKERD